MNSGFRLPLISLASALLLTLTACGGDKDKDNQGPAPGVLIATAGMVQINDTIEYIGRTMAVNDTQLRAQVEGYLLERRFQEGDNIDAGAELFVIDPSLYEAQVAAARGSVAEVEAALNRANQDVGRQTKLVKEKAASKQRLEEAQAAQLAAEAQLISAKAALQKAEIDLGHTVIMAPFKGRIGRAFYSIGSLVTPSSDALARLVELDPIYVNFSVSEGDVIEAKRRMMAAGNGEIKSTVVRLRLPDGSLFDKDGRIDFIDNVVDRKTGTVILRAKFPNPDKLLVPGLYVRTVLGREEASSKLTIPQSAIQENQAGKFVMVVTPDNKVEQRPIETGRADAGNIVVKDGLQAGENVIVEGIQKVRPGIVVEPKMAKNSNPNAQKQRNAAVAAPGATQGATKESAKADAGKDDADKDDTDKDEAGMTGADKDQNGSDDATKNDAAKDEAGQDDTAADEAAKAPGGEDDAAKDEDKAAEETKAEAAEETKADAPGGAPGEEA
jgi:membrane fusion protein (multidrug efflux system)